jgi:hypothetical protein
MSMLIKTMYVLGLSVVYFLLFLICYCYQMGDFSSDTIPKLIGRTLWLMRSFQCCAFLSCRWFILACPPLWSWGYWL